MKCGNCGYTLSSPTDDGGQKFRVKVTLIAADGRVHGPCRQCGNDFTIASGALVKAQIQVEAPTAGAPAIRPAVLVVQRRRRLTPLEPSR